MFHGMCKSIPNTNLCNDLLVDVFDCCGPVITLLIIISRRRPSVLCWPAGVKDNRVWKEIGSAMIG